MSQTTESQQGRGGQMERRAENQPAYMMGRIDQKLADIARRQEEMYHAQIAQAADTKAHAAEDAIRFTANEKSIVRLEVIVWCGIGILGLAEAVILLWANYAIKAAMGG